MRMIRGSAACVLKDIKSLTSTKTVVYIIELVEPEFFVGRRSLQLGSENFIVNSRHTDFRVPLPSTIFCFDLSCMIFDMDDTP